MARSRLGLVLTGGGARAAYQAGVLRGIAEMSGGGRCPFEIVTGVSAGAINAMVLAAGADDFLGTTARLWTTWSELSPADIFRTNVWSLGCIGMRWLRDLVIGGWIGGRKATHLLDTAPLRRLLASRIDFRRVRAHLRHGLLHGVAISATNYGSGATVTFFDGDESIMPWMRGTRVARRAQIGLSHVLASASIPLFFKPERLDGSVYGDGCVRLTAPLSPAIHLGADRVLAVGIRHRRSPELANALAESPLGRLELADIVGVLLNAVFLDSLESDLERMERINRTVALLGSEALAAHPDALRMIPVHAVRPSRDLGVLASDEVGHLPWTLRHLLGGLGASGEKGWDLLSYLAFDAAYTRQLLRLGREDAFDQADAIRALMSDELRAPPRAPPVFSQWQ